MNAPLVAPPLPWSRRHTVVFVAGTILFALLPWLVTNYATQDGPNHLAVAHVVASGRGAGSAYAPYLTVDAAPVRPSTAQYWILAALEKPLGLPRAEKVLASLASLLLALAAFAYTRRAAPSRLTNVLLVLPLTTGWAHAMGFVGFELALALGVLVLALGWQPSPSSEARPGRLLAAAAVLVLCAWFHPVMAVLAGLGLLVLEGPRLGTLAAWRRLTLVGGPAALYVVLAFALAQNPAIPLQTHPTAWLRPTVMLAGLVEYTIGYSRWELVPRGLAMLLLLGFLLPRLRPAVLRDAASEQATVRLVAIFLLLYATTPHVLADWVYCSARFLLVAVLALPAAVDLPALVRRQLPALALTLSVAAFAAEWRALSQLDGRLETVRTVGEALPRGAKLLTIDFGVRRWKLTTGSQPMFHAWGLLAVERDAVSSQLFAGGKPSMGGERFRMLSYRPGVLDRDEGALPWPGFENAVGLGRECGATPDSWECLAGIERLQMQVESVLDRYEHLLLIAPPEAAREALGEDLALLAHQDDIWLYSTR
jgi:hypothetical protein